MKINKLFMALALLCSSSCEPQEISTPKFSVGDQVIISFPNKEDAVGVIKDVGEVKEFDLNLDGVMVMSRAYIVHMMQFTKDPSGVMIVSDVIMGCPEAMLKKK
jgi:hypothetical protein